MLNHGISTGALFAMVGLLYERRHSLEIKDYGGVASIAPWLSTIFLVTTLASIGLPLLNNFVGEFLVLQGTAQREFRLGRLRGHRRDSLRLLHAVAVPTHLLRRGYGERSPSHVRSQRPRVGRRDSAGRDDGVDGRISAIVPAAGRQGHRPRARTDAGECAIPGRAETAPTPVPIRRSRVPVNPGFNIADLIRFLPEIILTIAATLLMVLDPLLNKRASNAFGHISILALIGAIAASVYAYGNPGPAFGGLLMVDGFATFFRVLVMVVGISDRARVLPVSPGAGRRNRRISRAAAVFYRRPMHHGDGQ